MADGTVLDAVESDLDAMALDSPIFSSLVALALALAEAVDEADPRTVAQPARQLRETLTTIAALAGGGESDRLKQLAASLSAPLLDAKDEPPKPRARSRRRS